MLPSSSTSMTSNNTLHQLGSNEDGQTPLHCLCKNRHVSVDQIRKALNAHPQACETQDIYGRTPLYYAIKANCSNMEVMDILCETHPAAMLMHDVCGQCPLYMAYRYGLDDALAARLLFHQPHYSLHKTKSFSGKTLLESLLPNWEHHVPFTTPHELWSNSYLTDGWRKLLHTLRAAHVCLFAEAGGQSQQPSPPPPILELHLALDLWGRHMGDNNPIIGPGLLRLFFLLYGPDQAKIPTNTNGRLPLAAWVAHHCNNYTMSKGMTTTTTSKTTMASPKPVIDDDMVDDDDDSATNNGGGMLNDVLQWLVQAYPAAAYTTDDRGQWPLHIALTPSSSPCDLMDTTTNQATISIKESLSSATAATVVTATTTTTPSSLHYYYCCQTLIYAAPDVLTIPDPITQLPPFLLAASNPWVDVDTIYTLLREAPHVVLTLSNSV